MSGHSAAMIRVPVDLRDLVRSEAARRGVTQSDVLTLAMRELAQADFLRAVAAVQWDDEAVDEAHEWDEADLSGPLYPWEPGA